MSDIDWTLYADGVCESLNRATTVEHAKSVFADDVAYALDLPASPAPFENVLRQRAAVRIAKRYRATITRLTENQGGES